MKFFLDPNRENLITIVYKQLKTKQRMIEPYLKLRTTLQKMHDKYLKSKKENLFKRSNHMQHMIHEVIAFDLSKQILNELKQVCRRVKNKFAFESAKTRCQFFFNLRRKNFCKHFKQFFMR